MRGVLKAPGHCGGSVPSVTFSCLYPLQGLGDQRHELDKLRGIGDDVATKQIFNGGQVGPALLGGNIGHICHPLLIGWVALNRGSTHSHSGDSSPVGSF